MERHARATAVLPSPNIEDADLGQLRCEIIGMQSKAKGEIFRCILLLDLAAQHARQIAKRIDDAAASKALAAQITLVEQLLQIAREMAAKL